MVETKIKRQVVDLVMQYRAEGMLPEHLMNLFFETWQTKRDGTRREMVEVIR